MQLLVNAFNPGAAENIMCRDTISVGWDGRIYDCDFNQQLAMTMPAAAGSAPPPPTADGSDSLTVLDLRHLGELKGRSIRIDNHCFGCTAGGGSSCTGSLA